VGPIAGLDIVMKRIEPRFLGRPARSLVAMPTELS
jgi:hypothetical protein